MSHNRHRYRFLFQYALAILAITGCAPDLKHPTRVCPGKRSASQSLDSLRLTSERVLSLKATGRCVARVYVEDKKYHESFPITLWVNPPAQIRLHGDVFLNPRGIVLGSNEREFWLAIKPKEISTYHWGLWSEQDSSQSVIINPKTLLEALGIVPPGSDESWALSNEGAFDVLTKRNDQGRIVKKVYIYSCDYRVSKIEYFNVDGEVMVIAELYKYREISEGCFVPRVIKIITYAQEGREDSVIINLNSVKPYEFDKKKQDIYFNRRKPKGFKHVYRIIDGHMIEQPE
ncbi:MAG: hypothetical protein ACYTEO_01485 [Planctomycetota bacterium]